MTTREIPKTEFHAAYDLWFKTVGNNTSYPKSFWEFLGRDSIVSYNKTQTTVLLSEEQLNRVNQINGPNGYTVIKAYVAKHNGKTSG